MASNYPHFYGKSSNFKTMAYELFKLQEGNVCHENIFNMASPEMQKDRDFVEFFMEQIKDPKIKFEIFHLLPVCLKQSYYFINSFLRQLEDPKIQSDIFNMLPLSLKENESFICSFLNLIKDVEIKREFYYKFSHIIKKYANRALEFLKSIDNIEFKYEIYQNLPSYFKSDAQLAFQVLHYNPNVIFNVYYKHNYPYLFKNMPTQLSEDVDLAMSIIRKNIYLIDYFSDKVTHSPIVVRELAACINKKLQFYKQSKLRYNRAYVLHAVSVYGRTLEFACKELQDDEEIVRKSIVYSARSIQYASYRLRMDTNILLLALRTNLNCIPYIPSEKIGGGLIKDYWRRITLEQKENRSLSLTMLFHLDNIEEGNSYPKQVIKNLFRNVLERGKIINILSEDEESYSCNLVDNNITNWTKIFSSHPSFL